MLWVYEQREMEMEEAEGSREVSWGQGCSGGHSAAAPVPLLAPG